MLARKESRLEIMQASLLKIMQHLQLGLMLDKLLKDKQLSQLVEVQAILTKLILRLHSDGMQEIQTKAHTLSESGIKQDIIHKVHIQLRLELTQELTGKVHAQLQLVI